MIARVPLTSTGRWSSAGCASSTSRGRWPINSDRHKHPLAGVLEPQDAGGAVRLLVLLALAAVGGVATAAVSAARHGRGGWRG